MAVPADAWISSIVRSSWLILTDSGSLSASKLYSFLVFAVLTKGKKKRFHNENKTIFNFVNES
jgi:hypothetical protein